jgi:acyl-CoA dehydrogenase
MAFDFSVEPEYQAKLDWALQLVQDEIYPLEVLGLTEEQLWRAVKPLQEKVRDQGLWAGHLDPELGGQGYGQIKLALLNEVVGRSTLIAPLVFGNQAPDSGNSEILGLFGTDEQKERWLKPLLAGEIRSAFSMTEPGAGADPTLIATRAVRDGDEWVINGHKWFTSNGSKADFLIVMLVTNPDVSPYEGMSMIIVPKGTPGLNILRDVGGIGGDAVHSEILYEDVRVPVANTLGGEGQAFVIAQKRLGPGRIHHCMRWIGQCHRAFDMLCERSLSRYTSGSLLADKQTVQNWIADSWAEIQAFRLMTLHAAWVIDTKGSSAARTEIAAIKFFGAKVLHDVIDRAVQAHGSLGYSTDLPLEQMYRLARSARIYDGPDEVHRVTVARRALKNYEASSGPYPTEHIPTRREAAQKRFAELLDEVGSNL